MRVFDQSATDDLVALAAEVAQYEGYEWGTLCEIRRGQHGWKIVEGDIWEGAGW